MAKKKGFFAEVNRQMQQAERARIQNAKQAERAQAAAERQAAQAAKEAERARTQAGKALGAAQKEAEREVKRLHQEAMEAEVESRNATLAADYDEIDSMLATTLAVDDFVDLEQLRQVVEHPPFDPGSLASPALQPPPLGVPAEPQFVPPEGAPKGLSGMLGGKKKYAEVLERAQQEFTAVHEAWQAEVASLPARQAQRDAEYQRAEAQRLEQLAAAKAAYDEQCRQREVNVAESNAELDQLIANLGYDVEDAIQEYVAIVLGNSVYPDCFAVTHEFQFVSATRELTLKAVVPDPMSVPNVRAYKYVKAKDEITETPLTQKDQKERYANAVAQVALRTLHEVFEADRVGRIQTISLTVVTSASDPATGQLVETPLIAVATDRPTFEPIDLANVVPTATLAHLNALVSKNPFGLVAIDMSKGVRG